MNDNIKLIKTFEEYRLSIKDVSETIKNEAKEEKGGFLDMLLGKLAASLLGNRLAGKGLNIPGREDNIPGLRVMSSKDPIWPS